MKERLSKFTIRSVLSSLIFTLLVFIPLSSRAAISTCSSPKENLVLLLDARNSASNTGAGSTWYDISGCGLNASLVTGVSGTTDSSPVRTNDRGGAFQFSRANQQWAKTNSPGNMNPYTVEAYYKVDSYNSLACTAVVTDSYDVNNLGKINFTIGTFGGDDYLYGAAFSSGWTTTGHPSSTFASDVSGWHVATLTYDGSNLQLYYDSATVGSATAFSSSSMGTNGNAISIAKRWDLASNCTQTNNDNFFNGRISVVKILNKALTSTEVQNEYRCMTTSNLPSVTVSATPINPKKQTIGQVLTATSNCAGTVNFFYNNRPIKACQAIQTTLSGNNYTSTCNWKPLIQGQNLIKAEMNVTYYPDNITTTSPITVLKRTSPR